MTTETQEKVGMKVRCIDCGDEFPFSPGEMEFYKSRNLTIPPKRCPRCRRWRRFEREHPELSDRQENISNGR